MSKQIVWEDNINEKKIKSVCDFHFLKILIINTICNRIKLLINSFFYNFIKMKKKSDLLIGNNKYGLITISIVTLVVGAVLVAYYTYY